MVDFGSALNVGFDFGGSGSDGVDALDAGAEETVQDGVVAALVFASENEVNVGRKRFERFDGGVDVGGFGIVVVIDAGDFGESGNRCGPALSIFYPLLPMRKATLLRAPS